MGDKTHFGLTPAQLNLAIIAVVGAIAFFAFLYGALIGGTVGVFPVSINGTLHKQFPTDTR